MKYFLDFDGVVFNVEILKEKITALDLTKKERTVSLLADIQLADPSFDLKDLVFIDAYRFIEQHRGDCHIVSSYVSADPSHRSDESAERAYQEKKIALSGMTDLLGKEQIHVVGQSKSEILDMLQQKCTADNEPCVFIDDREEHIREAMNLGVRSFLMVRNVSLETDLSSIHSFDELA